jgi:hypothetical protein
MVWTRRGRTPCEEARRSPSLRNRLQPQEHTSIRGALGLMVMSPRRSTPDSRMRSADTSETRTSRKSGWCPILLTSSTCSKSWSMRARSSGLTGSGSALAIPGTPHSAYPPSSAISTRSSTVTASPIASRTVRSGPSPRPCSTLKSSVRHSSSFPDKEGAGRAVIPGSHPAPAPLRRMARGAYRRRRSRRGGTEGRRLWGRDLGRSC